MKAPAKSSPRRPAKSAAPAVWDLRLYVAGPTTKSVAALQNLKTLCEEHLTGHYNIHVIDLAKTPQLAQGDQILAVPALVRHLPAPMRKVIGDLSNAESVLVGLDLRASAADPFTVRNGATRA